MSRLTTKQRRARRRRREMYWIEAWIVRAERLGGWRKRVVRKLWPLPGSPDVLV